MTTDKELQIRLIYRHLPHADDSRFEIGLQTKKGEIQAAVSAEDEVWVFSSSVKTRLSTETGLDFSGPLVQGTPGARFLYLSWKRRDPGNEGPYFWRVKIPLMGIPATQLQALQTGPGWLEADISGRKPHDTTVIVWSAQR